MRRAPLLPIVALATSIGCADEAHEGSAPIAFARPDAEIELTVRVDGNAERVVEGIFSLEAKGALACTTEVVEGCTVQTCTRSSDPDSWSYGTVVDPGALTVHSPSFGSTPLPPVDARSGFVMLVQIGDLARGEEVRVVATGSATLEAFDLTVRAAEPFRPTSFGGCTTRDACVVAESSPVAKWSGGGKIVQVRLRPDGDRQTPISLSCAFDGAAGAGRMPSRALAKLPREPRYTLSFLGFDQFAVTAPDKGPRLALVSSRTMQGSAPTSIILAK